ncbi:MAG TPA: glucose-1-phosphate adenylyltransferase subunit GlgD [Bacilli bacterium]|nr:glucose-1-phosphate adenylyltransferase subunit GlgD [Bacilli bacterium]
MNRVIGICNLHDGPDLGLLTENRPLGAVTFLGRYGLMDFALSNLSNSGIDRINILVEKNVRAVRAHVREGQTWINNTKTGYLRLFFNEKTIANPRFNTDISNLLANRSFFEDETGDFILITNPFMLASVDFRPFIDAHIASGAEASVIYKHVITADTDYLNCGTLSIEKHGLVSKISNNAGMKKAVDVSLGTYVFNRETFEKILRMSREVSLLYGLRKMLRYCIDEKLLKLNAWEFTGFVAPMLNLSDYINHSLELLTYSLRSKLFLDDWPIYTVTHNTPPALYGPDADVKNCFIANGCIIKGKVRNSIISRDVIIEEGTSVDNSIIFTKSVVGKGIKVNYVLADKSVKILQCHEVNGQKDEFLFIEQGAHI